MRQYTFLISFIIAFAISIFIFPQITFEAAQKGLELWLKAVIPSLFPFVVLMNLLVELNFFKVMGRFIDPFMSKLFRLPGCSGFIWLSSVTSGYPVGAKIIVDLLNKGDVSREEAQHLLNFCNNSGPLFILGTVAVGLLGIPEAGYLLLISHLISSLCIGFIYRSNRTYQVKRIDRTKKEKKNQNYDIGKLLGNSISAGMELMLNIGGFIILFSVIIHLVQNYGIISMLLTPFNFILKAFGTSPGAIESFLLGFIEITNGIALIAKEGMQTPLKLSFASFLIAWSGFSIHAQTASVIRGSKLKFKSYMKAKLLQGVISAIITYVLTPFFIKIEDVVPTVKFNFHVHSVLDDFSFILILIMIWILLIILTSHKTSEND